MHAHTYMDACVGTKTEHTRWNTAGVDGQGDIVQRGLVFMDRHMNECVGYE